MTNRHSGDPRPDFQHDSTQISERFRTEAELMLSLSNLFEKLPVCLKPTRIQTTMSFFPHDDGTYTYPEALQMRTMTASLADVLVTISENEDDTQTTTIELSDSDGGTIYVSRDPSMIDTEKDDRDSLFDRDRDRFVPIPRIPDTEIQSLLVSLVTHDPTATTLDYTGDIDQLSPNASILENSLREAAVQTMTIAEYQLSPNRSVQFITTEHDNNTKLASLSLSYETGSGHNMILSIDKDTSTKAATSVVNFRRYIDGDMIDFEPDDGDYVRAAEIIDEELASMETQRHTSEAQVRHLLSEKSLMLFDLD